MHCLCSKRLFVSSFSSVRRFRQFSKMFTSHVSWDKRGTSCTRIHIYQNMLHMHVHNFNPSYALAIIRSCYPDFLSSCKIAELSKDMLNKPLVFLWFVSHMCIGLLIFFLVLTDLWICCFFFRSAEKLYLQSVGRMPSSHDQYFLGVAIFYQPQYFLASFLTWLIVEIPFLWELHIQSSQGVFGQGLQSRSVFPFSSVGRSQSEQSSLSGCYGQAPRSLKDCFSSPWQISSSERTSQSFSLARL